MSILSLFNPKKDVSATVPEAECKAPAQSAETLEDVLLDLAKWGQPAIGMYGDDGSWHCSIRVNVNPSGVKFEARSDFKQTNPMAAALMCRENLRNAVKSIGGAA